MEKWGHLIFGCGRKRVSPRTHYSITPILHSSKILLAVLTLAASIAVVEAGDKGKADLTKRESALEGKRAPVRVHELKMNEQFNNQRIPMKEWHAEFNSLGRRRAAIDVRETKEKTVIRPEIAEKKKVDRKIAPQSGRMAYIRNFDHVREKQLAPEYRDAKVVTVQQVSRPAPANKEQETLSMRDINRFSFQRNHPDSGGPSVQKAGSGGEKR